MIKAFNVSKRDFPPTPVWPKDETRVDNLFEGRDPLRKITVMVDGGILSDSFSDNPTADTGTVLQGLLNSELVEYFQYAEEKPTSDVQELDFPRPPSHNPVYLGWAITYPKEDNFWPVTVGTGTKSYRNGIVRDGRPEIAGKDTSKHKGATSTAAERVSDILALETASTVINSDIYITERPYLFSGAKWTRTSGITICSPDEAITLLGLYHRAQGQFILPSPYESVKFSYNRGLFYWVGARELLSQGWRWHAACVQFSAGESSEELSMLSGSVLSRVSRALQIRDDVHIALSKPPNNDYSDDALSSLDNSLMLLMGAVDACARVAHHVLQLQGVKLYQAGWQSDQWIKAVNKVRPGLASVVNKGSDRECALTILRLLRNSIHGAALQGVSVLTDSDKEIMIGIPADSETDILAAMDTLGGRQTWGLKPIMPGRSHVEPMTLIDKLFGEIMLLINDLMRETPVELLKHVHITADQLKPPIDNPDNGSGNVFSDWNRQSIRLMLGL